MFSWWLGLESGEVGRGVEIEREGGQINGRDAIWITVEQVARAFFAREVCQRGKMFAEKQRGRTVPAIVVCRNDAATGGLLRRDELCDRVGGKRRLVAQRDQRRVQPS